MPVSAWACFLVKTHVHADADMAPTTKRYHYRLGVSLTLTCRHGEKVSNVSLLRSRQHALLGGSGKRVVGDLLKKLGVDPRVQLLPRTPAEQCQTSEPARHDDHARPPRIGELLAGTDRIVPELRYSQQKSGSRREMFGYGETSL